MTATVAIEISGEISVDTVFGGASVSTTVSTSLSNTWEESYDTSQSTTYTCEYYDNGATFTGGCMWQLKMTTTNAVYGNLSWTP